jgi:predicted MFS family arabinose efflux permease
MGQRKGHLPKPHGRLSRLDMPWLCYHSQMRSAIWIGIFIGSTIGGFIPELWGGDMISYSGVLLSGVGAVVGLWFGSRASR